MPQVEPIRKVIQDKLNSKRKILGRQDSSNVYSPSDKDSRKQYQQNIVKTPYIVMVSTQEIQTQETYYDSETKKNIKTGDFVDKKYPKGFYMLSNQEYSSGLENAKNNPNINVGTNLYNARSLPGKTKVPYRPAPGIKDLTSEFTSTNNTQFNRKVTVNFTCYSLADLEILTERFMTFNRRVFVQWGWATEGQNVEPLITEDGEINFTGENGDKKSDITKLQEEVITKGKGDFDAVIGFVNSFNWTLREDGGFDCTTELTAQGINILEQPIPTEDGKPNTSLLNKAYSLGDESKRYLYFFTDTILNLHRSKDKGGQGPTFQEILNYKQNSFNINKLYEGKVTSEVPEFENIDDTWDWADNPTEKIKFNITRKSKSILHNKNFIFSSEGVQEAEKQFEASEFKTDEKITIDSNIDRVASNIANESWVRWGWFEDNLINPFFSFTIGRTPFTYFRSVENGQSIKVTSDKDFITTDIRKFLFPGKFSVEPELPKGFNVKLSNTENELERIETEIKKNKDLTEKEKANLKSQEKKLQEELEEMQIQKSRLEEFKDIEEMKKKIKQSNVTGDNIDEIAETGYDKYLQLNGIEEACESEVIQPFEVGEKPRENGRTKGFLRNIFINIGFLQEIFKDNGASNLGEAMNILFKELSANTNGLIDMTMKFTEATNTEPAKYTAVERKLGESYQDEIEKITKSNELYEFPVHQQDSIVLSQELNTDLSSTQFTILQSKNLAEIGKDLSKKNISLQHQLNLNNTSADGTSVVDEDKPTTRDDLQIAFQVWGDLFGLATADEATSIFDWPFRSSDITKKNSGRYGNLSEQVTNIELKKKIKGLSSQSEKDLEEASNRFIELPIPYTIDGVLKQEYLKNQLENINLETVFTKDEKGNEVPQRLILKTSEYGLVGITTTITLTGIAGIYPSNAFTTSYLPDKFKSNVLGGCHFWTTGVTQNCSAETWTTQLEARMAWKYNK